eukprot:gnl/MRDRNA2_/MRDRNA2_249523_c0_seq1.p1 gnl/MRDRNA2_/MRDRNA2_249523_c0~~gnl/MRDRNA2_/MRDRNA2_249523_c0_seq1.p1  ORF type:complete len:175 (-),score=48.12 gnl/MRDRNA2_/MRDRNA2_249523_c0_seq1:103-627(-)
MCCAAEDGEVEFLESLLSDFPDKKNIPDGNGENALSIAIEEENADCEKLLRSAGCEIPTTSKAYLRENKPAFRVDPVQLGRVRLLASEDAFRKSFARFVGDECNGFAEKKLLRLGAKATVTEVFEDDFTVTVKFDDDVQFDLPWETIAEQISVAAKPRSHSQSSDSSQSSESGA